LNSGGNTRAGSAAETNKAFCPRAERIIFTQLAGRGMVLGQLHVVLGLADWWPP
jgi:hypothetical protein